MHEYKYLGLLLNNSSNFVKSIENVSKRTMKAIFKIKNIIHHANITTKSALHLFDSIMRLMMTYTSYSCEVWGAYILNPKMFDMDGDHSDVYDNKYYEKIDLRFCKMLLGVHRKATEGELVDTQFPCIF